MVKVYQWVISPFLGNNCRFYPTCSQYCIEAMEVHGIVKGLWLSIKRLSRCHPFCEGGVDPVPPNAHSDSHTSSTTDPATKPPTEGH